MIQWPSLLGGKASIVPWLNKVLSCGKASEVKQVIGGQLIENSDGKIIIVSPGKGGATESVGVAMYKLKSIQGDYLTCRTWDGTTEGATDVYIAKPSKLRTSLLSETIDGTLVTYAYDANFVIRAATAPLFFSEIHYVTPRLNINNIIYAITVTTGVLRSGVEVGKLDLNVDARAWARL